MSTIEQMSDLNNDVLISGVRVTGPSEMFPSEPVDIENADQKAWFNNVPYTVRAEMFRVMHIEETDDALGNKLSNRIYYRVIAEGETAIKQLHDLDLRKGDELTFVAYLDEGKWNPKTDRNGKARTSDDAIEYHALYLVLNEFDDTIDSLTIDNRAKKPGMERIQTMRLLKKMLAAEDATSTPQESDEATLESAQIETF